MKDKLVLTLIASVFFMLVGVQTCFCQDDLLADLRAESEADPGYISSTFKSTRVVNSHSVETLSKGNLDFRISHRFGKLNSGAYNLFGLDEATIRLALEYGLPVDPRHSIVIGNSDIYYTFQYDLTTLLFAFCLTCFAILFLGKKKRRKNGFKL